MKTVRINFELALYLLAFALGLGLRLYSLGAAPLSDFEAERALGALEVSRGQSVRGLPEPGYIFMTGALFALLDSSNALARFWPALAGSLLILSPALFRTLLGRQAALILAFGLALDAGLVALSRLAGGPMFALAMGLLALGFLYRRWMIPAAIAAGLALLAGPAILHGGLILLLTWSLGKLIWRGPGQAALFSSPGVPLGTQGDRKDLRNILLVLAGVLLFAGTLLFWYPRGLAILAAGLPAYLAGWLLPSGIPASRLIAALIVYQPLAFTLAVIAGVRAWTSSNRLYQWFSLWAVISLIIVLLYSGRQVFDLVWVLVPVWVLAAGELSLYLSIEPRDRLPALGQATVIFLLFALAWINLAGLSQSAVDPQGFRMRWAVIAGTMALVAVTSILVGLGWSFSAAKHGLIWGLVAGLGIYGLANSWWTTQLRPNGENELWYPAPAVRQERELTETLDLLSQTNTGIWNAIDVVVTDPAPSLRWALRSWPEVRFLGQVPPEESPSVIIANGNEPAPAFAAEYRGQDFAWLIYPTWQGALPLDWPRWLVFRDAPQQAQKVILWARANLFLDGTILPGAGPAP